MMVLINLEWQVDNAKLQESLQKIEQQNGKG